MFETQRTDYVVIGSGIAGLSTAIKAAEHGTVAVLTKGAILDGNTAYAQGGIAVATAPNDSPELHLQDTLRAGYGVCDVEAARILVNEGPRRIRELVQLGVPFDMNGKGILTLTREGAHSHPRIAHALGDRTGRAVAEVLAATVRESRRIQVFENTRVLDLLVNQGECLGVLASGPNGELKVLVARAVVLATGGCGCIYQYTTNSHVCTGDGVAMAFRAGARLVDMEFFQFHPTALGTNCSPLFLISEAVRGEGAVLLNDEGHRFMIDEHPWAELGPRDVVARGIFHQLAEGHQVFLDASPIGSRFPDRFPAIFEACRHHGIDPRREPIPVAPAAHFIMGGVWTDTRGRTTISRLYACGEVACTGVHGANRLASNSLLEGLVFANRISEDLSSQAPHAADNRSASVEEIAQSLLEKENYQFAPRKSTGKRPDKDKAALHAPMEYRVSSAPVRAEGEHQDWEALQKNLTGELQKVMWNYAGIVRSESSLQTARKHLRFLAASGDGDQEFRNMVTTAQIIVEAALRRRESRGSHFRSDYPEPDDSWLGQRVWFEGGKL